MGDAMANPVRSLHRESGPALKNWKLWAGAFCVAWAIATWFQRAPHFAIPLGALAYGLISRRGRWIGYAVAGGYFALWAALPVQTQRDLEVAVLKLPGMDCAQYARCDKGAIEWSHESYGNQVTP